MLVLSRKKGESITIPGVGVTITVNNIQGNVVRLGLTAPKELAILRAELPQPKALTTEETLAEDTPATAEDETAAESEQPAPAE